MAEWLCSGLQNRGHRFNSGSGLHSPFIFGYFVKTAVVRLSFGVCLVNIVVRDSVRCTIPSCGYLE